MTRRFHRLLGLLLASLYVYVVIHKSTFLPNLALAPPVAGSRKAGTGYLVAFGLPLAAIVCFLWPERLMWWFSPRTPPDYEYLFTEGAWYLLGYVLLAVGVGVLMLFR
jgi:hypothetical protein